MKSIGARLTLYYALAASLSAAVLFSTGYVILEDELVRGLDALNVAEFAELRQRLGPDYQSLAPHVIAKRIHDTAEAGSALFFISVDEPRSGKVFASSNLHNRSIPDVPGTHVYSAWLIGTGDVRIQEFILPPFDVTIATPLAQVRSSMQSYVWVCVGLLVMMAFTSGVIGLVLSRVVLRPLRFIRATAQRISSDNLSERIPVVGNDELADLAHLLNRMFDRLEGSFNQIKRFSSEASHELKTPLSLIRLHGEKLLEDDRLAPAHVEAILVQLDEVSRMNQIIEEMLFLSRAEANAISLKLVCGSPEAMVTAFGQDALALAEHHRRRFHLQVEGAGTIAFEERWLRQVWLNLLTNALAATPAGGLVTMHSRYEETRWIVEVADEGAGLAEPHLERMFERFTQFEPSDGPARGSGLGLAISRSIVLLHEGTIKAANRTDRSGLRVTVSLPLLIA
ncbi:MAG: HAMP domain-containing protein [Sphingomonadales bacterium]|nr:HAMP domain-containing protein [Sphingomonadales bacterium]MDE2171570.1 HAMP domain-containing protein [Sphingomonadales bacterium]